MKFRIFCLLFALSLACAAIHPLLACDASVPDPDRWQARVQRYLEKDKVSPPPVGGIVFTGSSSIDMWLSLAKDFPDLPVVRRGIGGTRMSDLRHFAPLLVYPLKPRIVVVYSGENDLNDGGTVDSVLKGFELVCKQIHAQAPNAPIVYLAIKPSPKRQALLPVMRAANDGIAALCAKDPLCTFVDVFSPMLNAQGGPRSELYLDDQLHMNDAGYRLWTEIVKPVLAGLEQRKPQS